MYFPGSFSYYIQGLKQKGNEKNWEISDEIKTVIELLKPVPVCLLLPPHPQIPFSSLYVRPAFLSN